MCIGSDEVDDDGDGPRLLSLLDGGRSSECSSSSTTPIAADAQGAAPAATLRRYARDVICSRAGPRRLGKLHGGARAVRWSLISAGRSRASRRGRATVVRFARAPPRPVGRHPAPRRCAPLPAGSPERGPRATDRTARRARQAQRLRCRRCTPRAAAAQRHASPPRCASRRRWLRCLRCRARLAPRTPRGRRCSAPRR